VIGMIVAPQYWRTICEPIGLVEIENTILAILKEVNCKNLALSGGVDSVLILSLMVAAFGNANIHCYNIACSHDHPDYVYSEIAARHFRVDLIHWNMSQRRLKKEVNGYPGDEIVMEFFRWIYEDRKVREIITCDGADEFNAGYYAHMGSPTEEVYYNFIHRLQEEQLIPLNNNSGKVKVILPYIFREVILLWAQIPLSQKVDGQNRKKIILELARRQGVPEEIINRRKYGFCDAFHIKGLKN